jgi:hypothetical protein
MISGSEDNDGRNINLAVEGTSVSTGELVPARNMDWVEEMGERGGDED